MQIPLKPSFALISLQPGRVEVHAYDPLAEFAFIFNFDKQVQICKFACFHLLCWEAGFSCLCILVYP